MSQVDGDTLLLICCHDIIILSQDAYIRLLLQVAFVDYGDTAWILEANVRRLHPKFIHLPIQAVECTLDGLKVNEEVDLKWAM